MPPRLRRTQDNARCGRLPERNRGDRGECRRIAPRRPVCRSHGLRQGVRLQEPDPRQPGADRVRQRRRHPRKGLRLRRLRFVRRRMGGRWRCGAGMRNRRRLWLRALQGAARRRAERLRLRCRVPVHRLPRARRRRCDRRGKRRLALRVPQLRLRALQRRRRRCDLRRP